MSFELHPHVARMADAMVGYPGPWAFCGGWAVDCWLGEQRRDHADIDITVFSEDQDALYQHFREWNLIPHDAKAPENKELWTGWRLETPAHIHARPPGEKNRALVISWVTPPHTQATDGEDLELVVNDREGQSWVLSNEPRITVPFERAVAELGGAPVAVPEVIAFYKATAYWGTKGHPRPHDISDFAALLPLVPDARRAWLHESIAALHPGHPWLEQL